MSSLSRLNDGYIGTGYTGQTNQSPFFSHHNAAGDGPLKVPSHALTTAFRWGQFVPTARGVRSAWYE